MKPGVTNPKKMVSRNVAIALGLICIALIGSLAYFAVTEQNTINSLQSQVKDLNDIVDLSNSSVWVENYTVSVTGGQMNAPLILYIADYAGYLLVGASSTNNDTRLSVSYSLPLPKTGTYFYNEVVNVSTYQQWNAFPILPTNNTNWIGGDTGVDVYVGCLNSESANVTISMIYYY
jgi:hypothetical protein